MRFAVVGDPVEHSLSPRIHTAAYEALGIGASYESMRVAFDGFAQVVARLRSGDLAGVNVTMPHKANAFEAVDVLAPTASKTRAVNTIAVTDGTLNGYNTDIAGVVAAWKRTGLDPGIPSLILGAGSAAAAALGAGRGGDIFVSARNPATARDLLDRTETVAEIVPWGQGVPGALVINATPLGMNGEVLPDGPLGVASGLIDMAYGGGETPAVAGFRTQGRPYADGLDMLVGQACEAFELFTGHQAPVDVMMAAARVPNG